MLKKIFLLIAVMSTGSFSHLKSGTLFSSPATDKPKIVDISGIDKALLLTELYSAVGLETYQLMPEVARRIIAAKLSKDEPLSFASIAGKKLDIDISGDIMDANKYDKTARISAQKVVEGIRRSSELAARS